MMILAYTGHTRLKFHPIPAELAAALLVLPDLTTFDLKIEEARI